MKRRRNDKTPLKQTRISNFFIKSTESSQNKRTRTDEKKENDNLESPDVILCTPPPKTSAKARKSLESNFNCKNGGKFEKVQGDKKAKENLFFKNELKINIETVDKKSEDVLPGNSLIDVIDNCDMPTEEPDIAINSNPILKSPLKCKENVKDVETENIKISNPKWVDIGAILNIDNPNTNIPCKLKSRIANKQSSKHAISIDETKNDLKVSGNIENYIAKIEEYDSAIIESAPILKSPLKYIEKINNPIIENSSEDFGFDDLFSDNWSSQGSKTEQAQYLLNFSTCLKCIVVSSETAKHGSLYETILIVKSRNELEYGRVLIRDMWVFCELFANDEISIVAVLLDNNWVVDALNGYISIFPETLIPSTSLVGSMFCRRRGVLSNIFKGLDSDSPIMTIGSLVHELFQKSLELPKFSKEEVEKIIDILLTTPNYLRMLYSSGMSLEDARKELLSFVPFIINFIKIYVTKEIKPTGNNFQGTISEIVDIEESVSSVNIGFKGRIDVTVNIKINGKNKKMPLELKTGRASFSNEHRCQVILYTIMMSEIGETIESGLLMYLKEGILEEIKATRVEIRDMIILRNDFVRYIKQFDSSILPEPIRMANCCKKCPYLTVCTAYLDDTISETHPIKTITPKIDPKHLEYFHKWSKLLIIENSVENFDKNDLKLTGIILENGCVKIKNEFKYFFKKENQKVSLSAGSFVQISTKNNSNYYGRIVQITPSKCSVVFDKEIAEEIGTIFNMEGYSSSMLSRYMTNIGTLMDDEYIDLRKIVVDLEPAHFEVKIPKKLLSKESLNILGKLNEDQQRAILKVLACTNYVLIEGPPGSGKTQTIASLVKVLINLKQTILIVGHTHSSVDNILLRLNDVNFLRLGNISNIHSEILNKSYAVLSKNIKNVTDFEKLFKTPVIASTCLGLDSDVVAKIRFDVCIVDESSQVLQPEVLKPLFAAKKFVLIGDKKQLRPVVKNKIAQELGMNISIFEHLYRTESIITLKYQYRMNGVLMNIANKLTYNDILKIGSEKIGKAVLKLKEKSNFKWLRDIMSTDLNNSIVFVDTSDYLNNFSNDISSCSNINEAKLIESIVNAFIYCGINESDIGVMAPFRAQIQILKDLLPNVEVNTIDQYQGRDKNCIIVSCTKQDRMLEEKGEYELLNDERRLTVAITRAKHKLIIVGDKLTLMRYQTFKRLFSFINKENFVELKENTDDFSWALLQAC